MKRGVGTLGKCPFERELYHFVRADFAQNEA